MRDGGSKIFQALEYTKICNIIPLLEKGLEVTKLEQQAGNDPKLQEQVSDGEMLLTFLHVRKFRH